MLCNAIRHKCKYSISPHLLASILEHVNLSRSYTIQATTDRTKFLNIVTEEFVSSSEKTVTSHIQRIYGRFQPGYFRKVDGISHHKPAKLLDLQAAAAIKKTITQKAGHADSVSYSIVIFENGFL